MKKNLLFNQKQYLITRLCLVMVCTAIVFQNCKKDTGQTGSAGPSEKVSGAKSWYEHTVKTAPEGTDLRTATVGNGLTDGIDLSGILSPLWDNGLAFEQDGEQVLELPVINKAGLMLIQGPKKQKYDRKHPESLSKLLVVKSKAGDYRAYVMTLTVDAGSTPDSAKLALNTFKHKEQDFNGMMLFHTLQGKLVTGYKYVNGAVTGVVSEAAPPSTNTQSTNGLKVNIVAPQPCQTAATNWMTATCTDWFTNGTYDGSNCTISFDHAGYVLICPDNGPMVQLPIPGGGGGGQPAATITNNVKNPCLKNMVDATINANVSTEINKLIQEVFGANTKINLTFVDVTNLAAGDQGYTPTSYYDANGNLNEEIQLNANSLPSCSQEYIATIIMHEALHAYLDSKVVSEELQHDRIINYVTKMSTSLQQMFPTLSNPNAKNLALGGLWMTDSFKNTIAADLNLEGSYDATQLAYSIGAAGTRCK